MSEIAAEMTRAGKFVGISRTTVGRILDECELKPHRTRYWLWSQDPDFRVKAASVLWYYERADFLAKRGVLVLCLDEKTGLQALGRRSPDRQPVPGHTRCREFEYQRHGVVNIQMTLEVARGPIGCKVLNGSDRFAFMGQLEELLVRYRSYDRIELILDNGPAHTAADTLAWFKDHEDRIRPHFTPKHASWLNQAELALSAFCRRYTREVVVATREALIDRIASGVEEYNSLHAKPFNWSFTRQAMHDWLDRKISRETFGTVH